MCYLKDVVIRIQLQNNLRKIQNKIVIGKNYPTCKNCVFYENGHYNNDKCNKFVYKSMVSGDFYSVSPLLNRYDETLCGLEAKHFIDKEMEFTTNYNEEY